jgi:hypothetical protein
MNIYDEFRKLSNEPLYQKAINIIESGILPPNEARNLANVALRAIAPKNENGYTYARECFWGAVLAFGSVALSCQNQEYKEKKAKWMAWKRQAEVSAGRQWPKKPVVVKLVAPPQVRPMK